MDSPRILVTGATGMIGSALVRRLVASGERVAIYRRSSSSTDLLGEVSGQVDHRLGDMTDIESIHKAFAGIDVVFHVAGHIGFGGRGTEDRLRKVNVEGTAHIVNAGLEHGIDRLVATSSMAAFGKPKDPDELIDEQTDGRPADGISAYALSKYGGELEVQRGIAEGLDAVIVNPALVFGEGRSGENTWRLVEAVRDGRLPGYPPGGTNVVDVLDVVEGHIQALHLGKCGERYFLGSENLSWREIMTTLAHALGVSPPRFRIPPFLILSSGLFMQSVARLLGTEPRLSLEAARLSIKGRRYSNLKAKTELGLSFRAFEDTADRLASAFA